MFPQIPIIRRGSYCNDSVCGYYVSCYTFSKMLLAKGFGGLLPTRCVCNFVCCLLLGEHHRCHGTTEGDGGIGRQRCADSSRHNSGQAANRASCGKNDYLMNSLWEIEVAGGRDRKAGARGEGQEWTVFSPVYMYSKCLSPWSIIALMWLVTPPPQTSSQSALLLGRTWWRK